MKICQTCKYAIDRNDGSSFCDLTLPPWLEKLLPDGRFTNKETSVEPYENCSFWKDDSCQE